MKKFFIAVALGTGLFAAQAVNAQSATSTEKKNVVTNPATATTAPTRADRTAKAHHMRVHQQAAANQQAKARTAGKQAEKSRMNKGDRKAARTTAGSGRSGELKKDHMKKMAAGKKHEPSSDSKR